MIHLHELVGLAIPECEPLDLSNRVCARDGSPTILGVWMMMQREGVLMIDRQWIARKLHASASRHPVLDMQLLQVRNIAVDAVMLRARGKLHVLAEQVKHASKLT